MVTEGHEASSLSYERAENEGMRRYEYHVGAPVRIFRLKSRGGRGRVLKFPKGKVLREAGWEPENKAYKGPWIIEKIILGEDYHFEITFEGDHHTYMRYEVGMTVMWLPGQWVPPPR